LLAAMRKVVRFYHNYAVASGVRSLFGAHKPFISFGSCT
jgi:hypothetical protein